MEVCMMSLLGNALESNTAWTERKEAGLGRKEGWLRCHLNGISLPPQVALIKMAEIVVLSFLPHRGWGSGLHSSRWTVTGWGLPLKGGLIFKEATLSGPGQFGAEKLDEWYLLCFFLSTDLSPFKSLRSPHASHFTGMTPDIPSPWYFLKLVK